MNGFILIDKPKGITSYDVCHKLKKIFKTRKVGHSGTLDPNATGLMIVAINKATKVLPFVYDDKTYVADVKFGINTTTQDICGEIVEQSPINLVSKDELNTHIKKHVGPLKQTPPIYSAIKVNGRKLYEYARAGEKVNIPSRDVVIHSAHLIDLIEDGFRYEAHVSAGTYIRTLSIDIAAQSQNIATTTELRRTKIGPLKVENANSLEDENIKVWDISEFIKYPKIVFANKQDILHGKKVKIDTDHDKVFLVDEDDNALAVYKRDGDIFRSVRGLF